MYVNDIQSGMCDAKAVPEVLNESAASAWVDGKNGLGAVVGNFCMDLAIKKAKETGIGFVVAKGTTQAYTMSAGVMISFANRFQSLWDSWNVLPKSHEAWSLGFFLHKHFTVHVRYPIKRGE